MDLKWTFYSLSTLHSLFVLCSYTKKKQQLDDVAIDEFRFTHSTCMHLHEKESKTRREREKKWAEFFSLSEFFGDFCIEQQINLIVVAMLCIFIWTAINDEFNWLRLENILYFIYAVVYLHLFSFCIRALINDIRRWHTVNENK